VPPRWEHFEHGADIGVRGIGPTLAAALEQAALALTAVLTDPAGVAPRRAVDIRCAAGDAELLLAHWLNALVSEMAVRRMLFGRFEVHVEPASAPAGAALTLQARAWGEPVVPARHRPAVEVKGATFTALRVAPLDDGWVAQTVVDV
jgi:tRNA nucleotidyltransferase (CCA-adding enzyme)